MYLRLASSNGNVNTVRREWAHIKKNNEKMLEMKNIAAKVMMFLGLINKTFVAVEQEFCQAELFL